MEMRRRSEFIKFHIGCICAEAIVRRQRLLDILNNEGYPAPIIVFVNQKKTADMVAKDLSRAGVSDSRPQLLGQS